MRASATIEIGGNLPVGGTERLAVAAERSGVRLDWNLPRVTSDEAIEEMEGCSADGCPVRFVADDALFGRLGQLEQVATELGLSWRSTAEGDNPGADASPGTSSNIAGAAVPALSMAPEPSLSPRGA